MVTETRTVEVPVEVTKELPKTLTDPIDYPPGLPAGFTVGNLLDLTFDLFDRLDMANADRAKAAVLTQPQSLEPVPQ